MMLRLCTFFLTMFLGMPAVAFAADNAVHNTGKAKIEIVLDRDQWLATETITGKVIFQITEVRDRGGVLIDTVRLQAPTLDIIFPDEMAAVLPRVKWKSVFFPTLKVGLRYELGFSISIDEAFVKLVKRNDEEVVLFNPGKFRISAMIDSPVPSLWDEPVKSQFVILHQKFTSDAKEITVTTPRSGRVVNNDEVKRALESATGELKHRIVSFYARRKVLSREDLLAAIEAAQGKAKADLASLYLGLNYPATDLKFFDLASETVKLTGHSNGQLYLLLRPQQRVRFACDLSSVHRLRVADLDTVLATKKQVDFDAPRGEGVYEMYDEANKKAWGWVLVRADKQAIASAGLRPDTTEISMKVAQALFKQDAAALDALAAPGFKSKEVIRQFRFKLGEGDIRYHESTGTINKVKTVMKINLAPEGQPAVFVRELWLEYVRVGEDLKLTNANVLEVEK